MNRCERAPRSFICTSIFPFGFDVFTFLLNFKTKENACIFVRRLHRNTRTRTQTRENGGECVLKDKWYSGFRSVEFAVGSNEIKDWIAMQVLMFWVLYSGTGSRLELEGILTSSFFFRIPFVVHAKPAKK